MTSYSPQIDEIIKENKIYWFTQELQDTQDDTRRLLIQEIIKHIDSARNPQKIKEKAMNDHIQILHDSQYKKRWVSLDKKTKLNRIQEFLDRNQITDETICENLKKYVEDGKLKTAHIVYNIGKGHISEIPLLTKNDQDQYELKSPSESKRKTKKDDEDKNTNDAKEIENKSNKTKKGTEKVTKKSTKKDNTKTSKKPEPKPKKMGKSKK